MKSVLILFACILMSASALGAGRNNPGRSQDEPQARDLYLSNKQPGTKVTIELRRDGRTRFVSPRETFYAGDQIRLHVKVNFAGYLAVSNVGSSGKYKLLFPAAGATNRVRPSANYIVPRGGYFTFDNTPGTERLTVIMSSKPIQGIGQARSFRESDVDQTEVQRTLSELDSETESQGRDLHLDVHGNAGYAASSHQAIVRPVRLRLNLIHR